MTGAYLPGRERRGRAGACGRRDARGVEGAQPVVRTRRRSTTARFTRTLRAGSGVTAAALRAAGIDVVSDEELDGP